MAIAPRALQLLRHFGIEIRRARPTHEDFPRLVHFLAQRNIDLVLDVGANRGQFVSALFDAGYQGEVVSFEPIPSIRAALAATAASSGRRWRVAPPMALGDCDGKANFHVARNTASSSFLNVLDMSIQAAPESASSRNILVDVRRLDSVVDSFGLHGRRVFLKLDVQGAEWRVIEGATRTIRLVDGIKIELSLALLYEGQQLAPTLDAFLRSAGFECWDIVPGFRNRRTGRLLQYDGIYFRR